MKKLYRLLVPKVIRSKVYETIRAKIYDDIVREIEEHNAHLNEIDFFVDIAAKHIQSIQILIDRNALLARLPKNAIVAELGVAEGEFSAKILAITDPLKLYLIDPWDGEKFARYPEEFMDVVQRKFDHEISRERVIIQRGYSTQELQRFPDNFFDWIYIDTDHSYRTTVEELDLCRAKVKENGIIAGHDYVTGGWQSKYRYGVVEAVHEFCMKHGWEMLYLTHEGDRHLSFALRQMQV